MDARPTVRTFANSDHQPQSFNNMNERYKTSLTLPPHLSNDILAGGINLTNQKLNNRPNPNSGARQTENQVPRNGELQGDPQETRAKTVMDPGRLPELNADDRNPSSTVNMPSKDSHSVGGGVHNQGQPNVEITQNDPNSVIGGDPKQLAAIQRQTVQTFDTYQ